MKSLPSSRKKLRPSVKQRGVVLFFALIALVVMSLAAVALIRSVDTGTMIAGNLALRQAATTSGDAGVEAAMNWLEAQQLATATNLQNDPAHPFNVTDAASGYYSNIRPNEELTNGTVDWDDTDSVALAMDASGNAARYIIERVCRDPDQVPTATNCLLVTTNVTPNDAVQIMPAGGNFTTSTTESTQFRITVKVDGLKNTVSYIQSFVY